MSTLSRTPESLPASCDLIDYTLQSDLSLIQSYAAGDLQAFEALYTRHKGGVYRYFMRHIAEPKLAEDLYQDVWSKVIVHAEHYQASAKFTTWLYTLAHNKLVDHIRHLSVVNKVIVRSEQAEPVDNCDSAKQSSGHGEPEQQLHRARSAAALKHCINRLPHAQKDSFLLKEEAGLSLKDIAQVLDTSLEASKSRLRYAYENLRKCLEIKTGRGLV